MEQQQDQLQQQATVQLSLLQNQPPIPDFTQPTAGESATPTAGQTDRSHSMPPQDAGMMLPSPAHTVPPARLGTPQVPYNKLNTQDSGSHMSQISGPLFTEDRLSTSSSDTDTCDTEVVYLISPRDVHHQKYQQL